VKQSPGLEGQSSAVTTAASIVSRQDYDQANAQNHIWEANVRAAQADVAAAQAVFVSSVNSCPSGMWSHRSTAGSRSGTSTWAAWSPQGPHQVRPVVSRCSGSKRSIPSACSSRFRNAFGE